MKQSEAERERAWRVLNADAPVLMDPRGSRAPVHPVAVGPEWLKERMARVDAILGDGGNKP